jgi:plastocyanin
MVATLIVEEPKGEVKVMIPQGSGTQKEGQLYYDPTILTVPVGTPVVWDNVDNVVHTVTSGKDATPDGIFDSGLIDAGKTFKFTFSAPGKVDYFCMVHPWMVGSVEVE